eukprot:gene35896-44261_t
MKPHLSIKQAFISLLAATLLLAALTLWSMLRVNEREAAATQAHQARYNSYMLADELRQSSDDLTRLARTYVVTGDARYEQQYNDILDIRNGKKPRPEHYERIYWWTWCAAAPTSPSTAAAPNSCCIGGAFAYIYASFYGLLPAIALLAWLTWGARPQPAAA